LLPEPNFTVPPDFEGYNPRESVKVNKSGQQITGSKTYEYVLIPRVPGISQIPAIEFSYFHPGKKSYETIRAGGFDIQVERGEGEAVVSVPGVSREEVKLLAEDIRYLKPPGRLLQAGSAYRIPGGYWFIIILPPVLAFVLWWTAKLMGATALQARRKDRKIHARTLRQLNALVKSPDRNVSSFSSVHRILLNYLGHRLDIAASGLKEEQVLEELKNHNTDSDVLAILEEIFQQCNIARFAPQAADDWQLGRIVKRTIRAIDKFESHLVARQPRKKSRIPFFLLLISLICIPVLLTAQELSRSDPTTAEDFYREGDYLTAISLYEEILAQGWTGGGVYYNLGNCYYKLGQYGRAILNYERARRFLGRDADLEHNLKLVNLRIYDKIEPLPRIFIIRVFMAISELFTPAGWARLLILAEWLLLGLAIGLYLIHRPGLRRFLVWGFFIALFVALVSGGFFVQQKIYRNSLVEGIVLDESVEVRSAPEPGATELFTLHEGVKVRIIRDVAGWAEIRLADGKRGWMPEDVFEII
jgi:tetratricopeptide (TPR) repeat protein